MPKRTQLLQGLTEVLLEWRPRVASVDRLVGKLAFALSLRPETRCLLQETYRWLRVYRERARRQALWPVVWWELFSSAVMLPFCQFNLSDEWNPHVEASGASPGGHGRAWTVLDPLMVQDLCRLSDHNGAYANLGLEGGIEVSESHACPLRQGRMAGQTA